MAAPTYTTTTVLNGLAVNFGFSSTSWGITITGLTGFLIQTAEETADAKLEAVMGPTGDDVLHGWHGFVTDATLECVITDLSGNSIATALTNTTLTGVTAGTFITITACAAMPDLATTSHNVWEVQTGAKISKSNTTAAKISIPIKRLVNITAAASA